VDLGGGSLQWTTVRDGRLKHALSLPLGAARMTREFLHRDPPSEAELQHLQEHLETQLAQSLPRVRPRGQLLVLGGTARALARRQLRVGLDGPKKKRAATLTLAELVRLRSRLQLLTVEQRTRLRGMQPVRADIVVAGALVLERVLSQSSYEKFTVCSANVRDGVLWREAARTMESGR